jgi:biopolymer transport protein ExbB/TolQ
MSADVFNFLGNLCYVVLFMQAVWGAYCAVMVWTRIRQKRFASEQQQEEFLEAIEEPLLRGEYSTVSQICDGDRRALCQLVQVGVENRGLGYAKVKQLIADTFQRDVLNELDFNLNWVFTMIKTAPMIGLLGTVMGMMGAFQKLSMSKTVQADQLASDIQLALITTACGLSIAVPLIVAAAGANNRIRKLQEFVTLGLNQFLEMFKEALIRHPK